jgi:hypothetical protein
MATIVPHLSWGLYWDGVVGMEASCEKNGWLNVLYVNNFYRQDEQVSGLVTFVLVAFVLIQISCKIFWHFALQVDPVIEFIQLGSTPFKDSAILVPKLTDPPFQWKSNSTLSKSGSDLPDPHQLICCTI